MTSCNFFVFLWLSLCSLWQLAFSFSLGSWYGGLMSNSIGCMLKTHHQLFASTLSFQHCMKPLPQIILYMPFWTSVGIPSSWIWVISIRFDFLKTCVLTLVMCTMMLLAHRKTALMLALCEALRDKYSLAAVSLDLFVSTCYDLTAGYCHKGVCGV